MYINKTIVIKKRGGGAGGICRMESIGSDILLKLELRAGGGEVWAAGGGRVERLGIVDGGGRLARAEMRCPFLPEAIMLLAPDKQVLMYGADSRQQLLAAESAIKRLAAPAQQEAIAPPPEVDLKYTPVDDKKDVPGSDAPCLDEPIPPEEPATPCNDENDHGVLTRFDSNITCSDTPHDSGLQKPLGVISLPPEDAESYLASRYERCLPFGNDGIKWFRVATENALWGSYYIVGVSEGRLHWGVPGAFSLLPPVGLEGHIFMAGEDGSGYWVTET